MNKNFTCKSKLSTEEINWHPQAQAFLLKGHYDQVTSLYEQVIETEPGNITDYWHLGLAYLLQGREEEAQATWFLAMEQGTCEEMEQWIEELVQILDIEAQRQAALANLQTSWIIRQHIREITPACIDNLLQLLQLSINLGSFTPQVFRDWQVVELLQQSLSTEGNPALLSQVLASTAELYLKLDREHLEALKYLPTYGSNAKYYQNVIRVLRQFVRPYKLHLGCGKVKFDGWINIDLNQKLDTVDIVWDVSDGLPFEDGSCKMIYHEHMLEHLSIEKGMFLLQECHRVLQVGGVLRVAMPSLDVLLEKANSENWRDQDWLTWPEYQFIQTRAEMLNISFRWWGHQWLYDREELHRRLHESGFRKVRDVEWGSSDIPELRKRETRKDSLLICEAWK
jgi:predicted SAM-dependent methyltransferase